MQRVFKRFFTSGHSFKEDEGLLQHRFILLNKSMLIILLATLAFSALEYFGLHDLNSFSKVNMVFASFTLVLIVILRRSKESFIFVAHFLVFIAYITFTIGLFMVIHDEYRMVWFLLLSYFSYMVIGKKTGFFMTLLSVLTIVLAHNYAELGISQTGFNTALIALITGSAFISSYTYKVHSHEVELKEKNDSLAVLATIDSLTKIYNRRAFSELGNKYVESAFRTHKPLTLLLLDIDHFKSINDTYGHHVGDIILREFAKLISGCLRKSDIYGRLGGEEFGVLLFETEAKAAKELADRILSCVEKMSYTHDGKTLNITVSIGISSLDHAKDDSLQAIEKRADKALYKAKENGRNGSFFI